MHHIVMFISQKFKLRSFSFFSVILTIVKNEWLTTNSQNAILNNFEEYYRVRVQHYCLLKFSYFITPYDAHVYSALIKFPHYLKPTVAYVF